jgi:Domain of unknown function (DUF4218)
VLDPDTLGELQSDIMVTLCELEIYFSVSFFDIMVHLTVHLVREIRLCGPMFLRYMYPFERAMSQLKGLVRSRSRPERNIVEGYIAKEVIEFYTSYLEGVEPIGLPKSRHEGRLQGVGTIGYKLVTVGLELRQKTYLKVLQHLAVVAPYVNEHLAVIRENNPFKGEIWVINKHNLKFIKWFTDGVNSQISDTIDEIIKWLAYGPSEMVHTYQEYDMNDFTWYTKKQDGKKYRSK